MCWVPSSVLQAEKGAGQPPGPILWKASLTLKAVGFQSASGLEGPGPLPQNPCREVSDGPDSTCALSTHSLSIFIKLLLQAKSSEPCSEIAHGIYYSVGNKDPLTEG